MRRFLGIVLLLPLALVIVTLAVANRNVVTIALDPFNPDNPALGVSLPLFLVIFAAIALGILIGGIADWVGQGYWRREAREKRREARRWRSEVDRLRDRMDEPEPGRRSLPPAL